MFMPAVVIHAQQHELVCTTKSMCTANAIGPIDVSSLRVLDVIYAYGRTCITVFNKSLRGTLQHIDQTNRYILKKASA